MISDSIYVIPKGKEIVLLNIDSLLSVRIAKADLFNEDMLNGSIKEISGLSYLDRLVCAPNEGVALKPTLVLGYRCNYACDYCFQKKHSEYYSSMLIEDIPKISEFLHVFCEQYGVKEEIGAVQIIGGEPLLPENEGILHKILHVWPDSYFCVTTNGTYLDMYFDMIRENRFQIKLSLDGTKDMHYRRRKPVQIDAYDLAMHGLKKLCSSNTDTSILTVFCPDWKNEYKNFFDELEDVGWLHQNNPKLAFIPQLGGAGCDDIDTKYLDKCLQAIYELRQNDPRMKFVDIRKMIPGSINLLSALHDARANLNYDPYRCNCLCSPNYSFLPDGTIHLCFANPSELTCVGKYKPNIEIYSDRVDALSKRKIDRIPKCQRCKYKALCRAGCPVTAISKSKQIDGVNCDLWNAPSFLNYFDLLI